MNLKEPFVITISREIDSAGYHVISMRDDFKTIYGENVKKTSFTFKCTFLLLLVSVV